MRYAVFPGSNRLAVEINRQLTVYDTLDHQVSGVSQQQGGNESMTFSSQYGVVNMPGLPVISVDGYAPQPQIATNTYAQRHRKLSHLRPFPPLAATFSPRLSVWPISGRRMC